MEMNQANNLHFILSRQAFIASCSAALLAACQGKRLQSGSGLQYGIFIQRYDGSTLFAEHADQVFPAASISKLLVAIALMRDTTALLGSDVSTAEVHLAAFSAANRFFPGARPGSHLPLALLLTQMIEQSDDFSANVLIEFLGRSRINASAEQLQLKALRVHGLFYDTSAPLTPRGYATARDCNKMLWHILLGARSGCSKSIAYERLLAIMTKQVDRRFIPQAVPFGTQVANKTGEIHGELNDAAIIKPFAQDPVLFTILASGQFNVFGDQNAYKRAVLEVEYRTRRTYQSLHVTG